MWFAMVWSTGMRAVGNVATVVIPGLGGTVVAIGIQTGPPLLLRKSGALQSQLFTFKPARLKAVGEFQRRTVTFRGGGNCSGRLYVEHLNT